MSISSGNVCWFHGPCPCGTFPDDKIFRIGLLHNLDINECVAVESGYIHSKCVTSDNRLFTSQDSNVYESIIARIETVNRLLKRFFILSHRFRHSIQKQQFCFMAVVNIVCVCIKNDLVNVFDI